jgi:hypothetical protein
MARERKPPNVDAANDYVAIFTPEAELGPAGICLVIVDTQYATGSRTTGARQATRGAGKAGGRRVPLLADRELRLPL